MESTQTSARPAAIPATGRPRLGRALSIERKLPLLMTGVLVVVLATSLALTYRTLARTARRTAEARLTQVARLFATTSETNTRQRIAVIQRAAADSAVRGALRSSSLTPAARVSVQRALASVQVPSDSGLAVTLWSADGRRIASVGRELTVTEQPEIATTPSPALTRPTSDSVETGPMYVAGGRVYFQVVAPVRIGDERAGYVVALRRVNANPRLTTQLRDLTGEDVALYAHQADSPLWTSLTTGRPTTPPTADEGGFVSRLGTGRQLTTGVPLPASPWILTLEEPLQSVLRAPREALVSLAVVSAILTVVGAAASWGIGRRIARPLASLTGAAEAVARGDYHSRVDEDRGDEIGRLAHSFNVMAAEVDDAQQALARQFTEVRDVARELEQTNRQLHDAMREVEQARDDAEQANRAKSDFLAVMSHELRTPLNAIGGYAELMQLGIYGGVTDKQTETLSRIARSQQHLLGLINDVLNFAKLSASKVAYDLRDVTLAESLGAVETMITPQIDAKALRYDATACDESLVVRADRDKLQQVLLNLLSNAVKFTPAGGAIMVACAREGATVDISVRDTGIGIPDDRLRHIFEPFVQVDRALNRPHEGVGLGLAISHDLAVGMGGELRAESRLGGGSTFVLRLPAA